MSEASISTEIVLKETLSAFLDHEAGKTDALELRRLARALEQDPELVKIYQRFICVSAAMRGESAAVSMDFLDRVRSEIEGGAAVPDKSFPPFGGGQPGSPQGGAKKTTGLKALGQMAIAASVAIVAVWFVQSGQGLPADDPAITLAAVVPGGLSGDEGRLGVGGSNRVLAFGTLTVSAGNPMASLARNPGQSSDQSADCVIVDRELPPDSGMHQMALPDGYVLCQMDESLQRCRAVSGSLACYSR